MSGKINLKIFKGYDIRGRYPDEVNEDAVTEFCRRFGNFIAAKIKTGREKNVRPTILFAYDSRLSSPSLCRAALNGLRGSDFNFRPIETGLATTPMFHFLVKKTGSLAGIMITASHNPKNENGLKIIDEKAMPFGGAELRRIYETGNVCRKF